MKLKFLAIINNYSNHNINDLKLKCLSISIMTMKMEIVTIVQLISHQYCFCKGTDLSLKCLFPPESDDTLRQSKNRSIFSIKSAVSSNYFHPVPVLSCLPLIHLELELQDQLSFWNKNLMHAST